MTIGPLIRDLRQGRHWSQAQLAEHLCVNAGRASLTREDVSRWERGKVIPRSYWLRHLAEILETPVAALEDAAGLSRMNRRRFLALTAVAAAPGTLVGDMLASMGSSDPLPLMTEQTTHATDLLIASKLEPATIVRLRRWMIDGDNPVLRVNAAGILAKMPDQSTAAEVARTLTHDEETRHLYLTAVLARVSALGWSAAGRIAAVPHEYAEKAHFLAARLSQEVLNPRDAGARWCSATLLRDLSPHLT